MSDKKINHSLVGKKINGEMLEKLNELDIGNNYFLVNCKNGQERRFIHFWCDENKLEHVTIKTKQFEPTYIYKCVNCAKYIYQTDLVKEFNDIFFVNGDFYYNCNRCGQYLAHGSDEESNKCEYYSPTMRECHNAILFGMSIYDKIKGMSKKKHIKRKNIKKKHVDCSQSGSTDSRLDGADSLKPSINIPNLSPIDFVESPPKRQILKFDSFCEIF